MLESVRRSHPRKTAPVVVDLTRDAPLPRELEFSYTKLRELCAPGNSIQILNAKFLYSF